MQHDVEMVRETYTFCRRCAARVEIGRVRVGTLIDCPACGLQFAAGRKTPTPHSAEQSREADAAQKKSAPRPPLWLFCSGTFGFPFRPVAARQLLGLATISIALVGILRLAVWCLASDNDAVDKFTKVLLWNGLLFSSSSGILILTVWTLIASSCGLTILRETSEGNDSIRDWPNLLALEGHGDSLYLINAAFCSAAPGLLLGLWLPRDTVPLFVPTVCSMALCFPVFLLSMLVEGSPTRLFSPTVGHSILWAWRAWLMFHAAGLPAAVAMVSIILCVINHFGWPSGIVVSGIVAACAWIVYFRLLGRLAWFCSSLLEKHR